ncbi:MAG TPA: dicarboxylate/amino acid:cation symporter [Methylophilaceae bacterium]
MRISLNLQIFIGAALGIAVGLALAAMGKDAAITQQGVYLAGLVGGVFVDLLKMVLVPLVFSSIAVGVANLRAHNQIHRVWLTTLIYSFVTMTISLIVGISASTIFAPGKGLNLDMFQSAMHGFDAKHMTLPEFLASFLHSLFMNPFAALAQGNVMAIVVVALFVGIALVLGGDRYRTLLLLLQELFDLSLRIVGWIMVIAPLGIMALLIKLAATQDVALLSSLAKFVIVILGTTVLHGLVVLPLILYIVTRVSPLRFFRGVREALVTAFATSSSSATMPITLRCMEQNLHVDSSITGFVVPLGAHLNMDGTALYEAAAALFVANLAGVDLNLVQQIVVCLTAMMVSIGAPGIPSAGMVTMIMVLQSVGLPAEAIVILLPIDRLLDTVRTVVNVEGDMVGCMVVQKVVGEPR